MFATTYEIKIPHDRMDATDSAIRVYLLQNPGFDFDGALDTIFALGVDTFIANCTAENCKPETENGISS